MKTEHLERFCGDVAQGRVPLLTLKDEFQWSGCTMCGLCCFGTDTVLSPYDILRIRRHLGCTTSDLIQRGLVEVFAGGSSGLPLAMIALRKLDNGGKVCPFLQPVVDGQKSRERTKGKGEPSPEDVKAARTPKRLACGVYPARPAVCRSSPLGRLTVLSKRAEDTKHVFCHPPTASCRAIQGEGRVRVADWIKDNGVQPYWDASERFNRLFSVMLRNGLVLREGIDRPVATLWTLAATILYDFDAVEVLAREFPQNRRREDAEEDRRLLSRLCQLVEMIVKSLPPAKDVTPCQVRT